MIPFGQQALQRDITFTLTFFQMLLQAKGTFYAKWWMVCFSQGALWITIWRLRMYLLVVAKCRESFMLICRVYLVYIEV